MKDLRSSLQGKYEPSFFNMKVDIMSYNENMSDREISLFVHEYIHYLQNITTIYGLERLLYDFSILCRMVEWVWKQKSMDICVPISEDVLSELTRSNKKILDLTWGDTVDYNIKDFQFVSAEKFDSVRIDEKRSVDTICITYKNKSGEEDFCLFGAREITESMAYLIEREITRDYENSPAYPYEAAQMVVNYIYPPLLDDKRNFLIVCDMALMSSNPGAELFEITKWLKMISYTFTDPREFDLFLDLNWEFNDMGRRISHCNYFINRAEDVRNNLHTILRDEYFSDYHAWVDCIIDRAIFLRKSNPLFWLDLVELGYIKSNPAWEGIINWLGSPLIETIKHEIFHVDPLGFDSSCTIYFKVFNQIYRLLRKGEVQCELLPWCYDKRNIVEIDATCFNCPWNHSDINGQLCTFKGVWNHWGLEKYKIRIREPK